MVRRHFHQVVMRAGPDVIPVPCHPGPGLHADQPDRRILLLDLPHQAPGRNVRALPHADEERPVPVRHRAADLYLQPGLYLIVKDIQSLHVGTAETAPVQPFFRFRHIFLPSFVKESISQTRAREQANKQVFSVFPLTVPPGTAPPVRRGTSPGISRSGPFRSGTSFPPPRQRRSSSSRTKTATGSPR